MRQTSLEVDVCVRPLRHSRARCTILRQGEAQQRLRVRHDFERQLACAPALPGCRFELWLRRRQAVGIDYRPSLELERQARYIVAGCRRSPHAQEGTTVTLWGARQEKPVRQEIEVFRSGWILPIGITCPVEGQAMPDQRLHAPTAAAKPVTLRLGEDDRCWRHGPLQEELALAVSRRTIGQLLASGHANDDAASNDKGGARLKRSKRGEDLLALSRCGEREFGGDHRLGGVEQYRREWNGLHHVATADDGNAIFQRHCENVLELTRAIARCRRRYLVEGQDKRRRAMTVRDGDTRFLDEPDLIERQGVSWQHLPATIFARKDIGICRCRGRRGGNCQLLTPER